MPKAGFLKLCNYCKNHPIPGEPPVLEKGHRPCEKYNNKEHLETCKPCRQNHRKTENVRKWRAKKINKKPADKEIETIVAQLLKDEQIYNMVNSQKVDENKEGITIISDEPIEMTEDDYFIEEETGFMETESSPLTELPDQERKDSGNTLVIQHPSFPNILLNADDVMRFQNQIESLIDDMRENDKTPKFISHILENGCWRVTAADEFTLDWFKEKASAFTCLVDNTSASVRVIPLNELPRFICWGFIPGKVIESGKILSRIQKQNSGLNTSRWYISNVEQQLKQFRITFVVDPLSFDTIQENKCLLNLGMNQVKLFCCTEVEEKNEESEGETILVC